MNQEFEDAIRDYIDFANQQAGSYMDALAGFAGHYVRVERQTHRITRPTGRRTNDKGETVVVWASYEDPTLPDVIHNRIIRAPDYLAANAPGGSNEQQHARAIVVFLFTYWEDEIRPKLAKALEVEPNKIRSDIMGDMRILRNAILHAKTVIRSEEHRRLTLLGEMFPPEQRLHISYEDMHRLFVLIKQDCARLLLEGMQVKDAPFSPTDIQGIAIQRGGKR